MMISDDWDVTQWGYKVLSEPGTSGLKLAGSGKSNMCSNRQKNRNRHAHFADGGWLPGCCKKKKDKSLCQRGRSFWEKLTGNKWITQFNKIHCPFNLHYQI